MSCQAAVEKNVCSNLIFNEERLCLSGQVDGFRFDIMGHLMVPTMQKIQHALGALTLEKDGVDGSGIYIYGEAWDFGEVPARSPSCSCTVTEPIPINQPTWTLGAGACFSAILPNLQISAFPSGSA